MSEQRPRIRTPTWIAFALIALLTASGAIARFYTDVLWFEELGQTTVFWRTLGWKWGTGAASALAFFAVIYLNLRIAHSMAPKTVLRSADTTAFRFESAVQQVRDFADRIAGPVIFAASVVAALIAGVASAESWKTVALAFSGNGFGVADPQFGRDIGFFFFTLPALDMLR